MAAIQSTWLAPAKLNLFLHITGRRSDGYHELQTLFQLLDYGDSMQFSGLDAGILQLELVEESSLKSVPMDQNLIIRAAEALRQHVSRPDLGAKIQLCKRIPMGAGLGGGSSNAAITLLALNDLWGLDLTNRELCSIAVNLGADVPVFINGKTAWAEGIGEQLEPVELPENWYLVVSPDCAVPTAAIFCHEDLTRNTQAITIADFLGGGARNDCELVTRKLYPAVAETLDWLSDFGDARMTGTGSSVFTSFEDESSAREVLSKLPAQWQGFVAKGINSLEQNIDGA